MPRFCVQCGKRLNDNDKFCTSCGAAAPADEQETVILDNDQTPAINPGATQRWAATATRPQPVMPSSPARQETSYGAAAQTKKATPAIAAVIVIVAALAIAGVVIFVVKPFDSNVDAQETKIEKSQTAQNPSEEETPLENDPNTGAKIADESEAASEKTASTAAERDTYNKLSSYYGKLSSYDKSVRSAATTFNQNYLKDDYTVRDTNRTQAENLRSEIQSMYDEVNGMTVDVSSKNYDSWKGIINLYNDLYQRIDVICDAWDASCGYSSPEDHKDEIVAPLSRDNISGTNDNRYRLDYEQNYDAAKPVEVE